MKKGLLALFLATSVASFSIDAHIKLGAITNSGSYNKEDKSFDSYGFTGAVEVTQTLLIADVGAGIAYNGKVNGTDISTIPAYGLVKLNVLPIGVKPYLVGKVGQVLHTDDNAKNSNADGNYYYGVGFGLDLFSLQAEALYSVTEISGDKRGNDKLEQVSLTLGYRFF